MSTANVAPQVDLDAIQNEIENMSPEQQTAELLKFRVRQKKQQKKQQGSSSQKAYQAKQKAKMKLLKENAIKLGLWDKLNEEAEAKAEAELAAEAEPEDETEEVA